MANEDRVRMECDRCGYKCVPQWLNDKAHCLKCQNVLRVRAGLHDVEQDFVFREVDDGRRLAGEVSTYKLAPSSAMESASGSCSKAPDGVHHWKYGKCNFCQKPEGKLAKGPGVMANPGGAAGCPKGGKCMFKFAKCTKCGRGEMGMKADRLDERRVPSNGYVGEAYGGYGGVRATILEEENELELPGAASTVETPTLLTHGDEDRVKMTCHVCGYKSVPQWLNDKAHCLKCDAIVKSRQSLHGEVDLPENLQKDLSSHRAPGEASTYKTSPGSAMESAGGSCLKSPDGVHHWKYGKCNYCQKGEGKFVKGAGALANPGGAGGCSKDGGKCMFKFSKCTKCGRSEF